MATTCPSAHGGFYEGGVEGRGVIKEKAGCNGRAHAHMYTSLPASAAPPSPRVRTASPPRIRPGPSTPFVRADSTSIFVSCPRPRTASSPRLRPATIHVPRRPYSASIIPAYAVPGPAPAAALDSTLPLPPSAQSLPPSPKIPTPHAKLDIRKRIRKIEQK
ncbi:hypothetical protein B0H16DRAFT_1717768 [Mycena metata]|uniref:Uncharacterized protein n=1 Tax=Mycena metata TaxID=1033252 RepID=A0AAD7JIJ8_9AGAR|nr:hypothetical protein B0H16DRAFT_1717768 [Mycena metata]